MKTLASTAGHFQTEIYLSEKKTTDKPYNQTHTIILGNRCFQILARISTLHRQTNVQKSAWKRSKPYDES